MNFRSSKEIPWWSSDWNFDFHSRGWVRSTGQEIRLCIPKKVSVVPVPVFFVVLEDVSRLPWIPIFITKLLKNKFNEENFKDLIGLKFISQTAPQPMRPE